MNLIYVFVIRRTQDFSGRSNLQLHGYSFDFFYGIFINVKKIEQIHTDFEK